MSKDAAVPTPTLNELVRAPRDLVPKLQDLFPSEGSLDWEIRQHRREYIAAGALFEIAGRLLAHPLIFRQVALQIGAKKLAERHGVSEPPRPPA